MNKFVLAPILAGSFALSPLAMADDMNTADSKFLFDEGKASAKTLSHEEMKSTEGKLALGLVVDAGDEVAAVGAVLDKVLALIPPVQIGDIDD